MGWMRATGRRALPSWKDAFVRLDVVLQRKYPGAEEFTKVFAEGEMPIGATYSNRKLTQRNYRRVMRSGPPELPVKNPDPMSHLPAVLQPRSGERTC